MTARVGDHHAGLPSELPASNNLAGDYDIISDGPRRATKEHVVGMSKPLDRKVMRWTIAAATALTLGLSGCGSTDSLAPIPPQAASTVQVAPAMLRFGQVHTWPNGDTVTVERPRRHQIASPSGDRANPYMIVDLVIHNGGQQATQVASYVTRAMVDDTALLGEGVTAPGITEMPGGSLAPGHGVRYQMTFPATTATPVKLQIQVFGEMYDPMRPVVFFEGTV